MLMALASCWRMTLSGTCWLAIMTMVSRREKASRVVLAWTVVMEPSWPVFMACSMSSASGPRDSPTMMRSGRIRRVLITRSRCVIAPAPSMLAGRVSRRTTWFCCRLQFGGVFDGDDALFLGNEAGERVEHGGLAGAGTAGDHDVEPRLHAAAHEIQHAGGEGLVLEQVFGGENASCRSGGSTSPGRSARAAESRRRRASHRRGARPRWATNRRCGGRSRRRCAR